MPTRNAQVEIVKLRSQLGAASHQVVSATTPKNLERALENYMKIGLTLHDRVSSNQQSPRGARSRMQASLQRVNGMRDFMGHLNALAESIIANTLASSKG